MGGPHRRWEISATALFRRLWPQCRVPHRCAAQGERFGKGCHQIDSRRLGGRESSIPPMEGGERTDPSEYDSYFRGGTRRTGWHGAALCRDGVRGRKSLADSSGAGADAGGNARHASAGSAGVAICARQGFRAWTHSTFKYSGRCGSGEAIERRSEYGGREEQWRARDERLRFARSGDESDFDGWRRLAVGDDIDRGVDATLAGLGSRTDERAASTGGCR